MDRGASYGLGNPNPSDLSEFTFPLLDSSLEFQVWVGRRKAGF